MFFPVFETLLNIQIQQRGLEKGVTRNEPGRGGRWGKIGVNDDDEEDVVDGGWKYNMVDLNCQLDEI